MSNVLLLVPNHPNFYPHIARHATALRTRYDQVFVGAVFEPGTTLPQFEGITFFSIAPDFPIGIKGFYRMMRKAYALCRELPVSAVEAVDPPNLVPAALAILFRATKLVYFSMEIFSATPALAKRPWRRRIWALLEVFAVRRASAVLTVNQSVAHVLEKKLHVSPVGVVRSMPPIQEKSASINQELRNLCELGADDFVLVYQGYLEPGRGIEFVSDCLKLRPQIHLAVMGFGPMQAWVEQRAHVQGNIHYAGAHPFEELMRLASGASAGLVWIEPLAESYRLSLPGKIFEYIQSDLPVLGSPLPEITSHIVDAKVGEVAKAFTGKDFLAALDMLVSKCNAGGYQVALSVAQKEWCWESEQLALLKAFSPRSR